MSLTNFLARKLINYDSELSYAFRLRKKRAARIEAMIDAVYHKHKKANIIDIGGTKTYWNIIPRAFLKKMNVHITVVNLPSNDPLPENDELFTFVVGDGCNLSEFDNNTFHIAHSNSVIEHVGSWDNMCRFSSEIQRIAEQYYLQTPNYWFPIEPHFMTPFFHWFSKSVRARLLMRFKLGWYPKAKSLTEARRMVETCNLLSGKDLNKLFPKAIAYEERVALITKSFVLIG